MSRSTRCNIVNLVGDRYGVQLRPKEPERVRRQKTQDESSTYEIQDNLPMPTWTSFVANAKNKATLPRYLTDTWYIHPKMVHGDVQLILGGLSSEYANIQGNGSKALSDLSCESHEEADTRIFAHLAYCVHHYSYSHAAIQATDTDILVIVIYHIVRISGVEELWLQKGATYIPCHRIARQLAENNNLYLVSSATSALLYGHVMGGCDTVSYSFRRGTIKS